MILAAGCRTTCDGRTESEECAVHNVWMRTVVVDNGKPPPQPPAEYLLAEHDLFPHSYPYVLPDKCKSCTVYICDDCVKAEQRWRAQHGMPPIAIHGSTF